MKMLPLSRTVTKYENNSTKFLMRTFDYQKQFSHLYTHRLTEISSLLLNKIQKKYGTELPIKKMSELREEQVEKCIIVGTIYKHQAYKPSILREISEENQLAPQPPRAHYSDPEDKLILEDEVQRVRLCGEINIRLQATGVVCAAIGCLEEDGRFVVEEMIYYESGPQRSLPTHAKSKRLLVLASGLDQLNSYKFTDNLNLFQNWLCGNLPNAAQNAAQLCRLIIAGNSVKCSAAEPVRAGIATAQQQSRNIIDTNNTVQAMRELDSWFSAWSQSIPIDVMPGPYDPTNFMLPQQPFHTCMFPKAAQNSAFHSVTNPYACTIDEALIVGTSGQNINDLLRCTMLEEPLEALRCTLRWSHIAPTAPDTLACYPYIDSDPFIMKNCPHIYFTGNCAAFATDLHEGSEGQNTRLVCVPKFSVTKSVVVVDLETLDCRQVYFNFDE